MRITEFTIATLLLLALADESVSFTSPIITQHFNGANVQSGWKIIMSEAILTTKLHMSPSQESEPTIIESPSPSLSKDVPRKNTTEKPKNGKLNINNSRQKDKKGNAKLTRRKRRRYKNSTRERSIAKGRDPIISLNMNLDYLAKSGQRGAAHRAEELLLRIEALYSEGYYQVKPDSVSYNSVMNAYAISTDVDDSPKEVERLLKRMENLSHLGDETVKPTIVSFNTGKRNYYICVSFFHIFR